MTNEEYVLFEAPFREVAKPAMEKLRDSLVEMGYGPFSGVEIVDKDVDRGLEFTSISDPSLYVELMLTDGGEHGFEGVGLMLTCSVYASGAVWAPGNYTEDVGCVTPQALVARINEEFSARDIAQAVVAEWQQAKFRENQRSAVERA